MQDSAMANHVDHMDRVSSVSSLKRLDVFTGLRNSDLAALLEEFFNKLLHFRSFFLAGGRDGEHVISLSQL